MRKLLKDTNRAEDGKGIEMDKYKGSISKGWKEERGKGRR